MGLDLESKNRPAVSLLGKLYTQYHWSVGEHMLGFLTLNVDRNDRAGYENWH